MHPVLEVNVDILQQITNTIVKVCEPERVILFGSRAANTHAPYSDIDLLVVIPENFSAQRSRIKEISRIEKSLRGVKLPTDLLVYSQDEIERWKDSPTHIIHQALRQGKVLYERTQ